MSRLPLIGLILALDVALVATASCASPSTERLTRPTRRSPTLITKEELDRTNARDALQAVEVLRPDWLRGRGATSLLGAQPEVVVYLDGQRLGPRQMLAQITVIGIKELRFHGATDATQRWGTGHGGGVIEVVSR